MTRPPAGPEAPPVRPPALPGPAVAPPVPGAWTAPEQDRRTVRAARRARRRVEAGERRRGRPFRRPRAVWALLAGVVLLVGVPPVLAFGPVFPVRTIAVSGAPKALAAQVRNALRAELGRPVALVGDRDVAAALRRVPAVERFTVVRRPPDTLEVTVVRRSPVVQQRTGGGWVVLDAARVRIETLPQRVADLPVLTIPDGTARPAAAYASAASAVRALAGGAPAVAAVRATSADDVVLTLRGGLRVRWGSAENGGAKAEALRAALVRAARGAAEIDVSSPGVVRTR